MFLPLFAILAGACAELPVLMPNACGNGALEGGEDCDLFVPSGLGEGLTCSEQCRFVCDLDAPTPACPAGWACGIDDICRFGSGAFEATADSPLLLPADFFHVGDIDGDGAVDVLGGSADSIDIRFGNLGPGFREQFSLSTDLPVGRRTLTHVGRDEALDVVSPTQQGVDIFFGDPARVLIPIGVAALSERTLLSVASDDARFVPMRASGRSTDSLVAIYVDEDELKARVTVMSDRADSQVLPLGPANGQIIPTLTPVVLDAGGQQAMAVAVQGESEVHVIALTCQVACQAAESVVRVGLLSSPSVAHLGVVAGGAQLADITGDGIVDLLISVKDAAGEAALVLAEGEGAGQFAEARIRFSGGDLCPKNGCWPSAIGDLNADGRADFVYPNAIWSVTSSTAAPRLLSVQFEPFAATTLVDLNGDGLLDVVGASETRPVLQILLNAGGLFNRLVLDIRRPAQMVQGGDFDGDGVFDIALVQNADFAVDGQTNSVSDVSIIFGSRSGPVTKSQLLGRFLPITRLSAGYLPSRTLFGDDAVSDLVVQVEDQDNGRRLGFMTGSAHRRLHAPLPLPVLFPSPSGVPSVSLGADMRQTGARDLVAFTFGDFTPGPEAGPFMYVLGEDNGAYPLDSVLRSGPEDSCLTPSMLGYGCLQATAGRLFGESGVLLVNQRADCPAVVSRSGLEVTFISLQADGQPQCRTLLVPLGASVAGQAQLADVDADGTQEAVLLLHSEGRSEGKIAVWSGFGSLPHAFEVPGSALDFVAVDVDEDPELELAVLTRSGISIADATDGLFQWPQQLSVPLAVNGLARLRAADMDGDGLQDLLVGTPDRLFLYRGQQSWVGGPVVEDQPATASTGGSSLRFSGAPSIRLGE